MLLAISDVDDSINLREIIRGLLKRYEVTVAYVGNAEPVLIKKIQKEVNLDWKLISPGRFLLTLANLKSIYKLIRNCKGNSILISGYKAQLHFVLLGRLLGKQVTFIRHYTDTHHRFRKIHWWLIDIGMNALTNNVIAVSSITKSLMTERESINPRKIHVLCNAVDLTNLTKIRLSRGELNRKSGEPLRILSIARHVEIKGLEYVLASLLRLESQGMNFQYTLIGAKTPYSRKLDLQLSMFPKGKVRIITDHVSVNRFLMENHVLIHVPIRPTAESFGIVYLEGLISGIECLFTQSGILLDSELASCDSYWKIEFENTNSIERCLWEIYRNGTKKNSTKHDLYNKYSVRELKKNYLNFMMMQNLN